MGVGIFHSGISDNKVPEMLSTMGGTKEEEEKSWRGVPALTCTDLKKLYKSASYNVSVFLYI